MAEDEGAAPRDSHGFLHIGCNPLAIRDARVNAAFAALANQIAGQFAPCNILGTEIKTYF